MHSTFTIIIDNNRNNLALAYTYLNFHEEMKKVTFTL